MSAEGRATVAVWPWHVRLLHWTLAGSIVVAWCSGHGWLRTAWHDPAGYVAATCVGLRLLTAVFGGRHVRFADFVVAPRAVWRYTRAVCSGIEPRHLGHNPLGGWMVMLLLSLVATLAVTGWLLTTDRFWGSGPLAQWHAVVAWTLCACVPLHVAGVLYTGWKHHDALVRAMLHGRKRAADEGDIG